MADFKVITSDFVKLQVSTSKAQVCLNEKRFPKDISIAELKGKLELITGGSCHSMKLEAYNSENKLICALSDDNALLGSYPLDDGMRLHVIDVFNLPHELDFGSVEKFEISEEEYAKKPDTVRAFLQKNKLRHFSEEYAKNKELQEEKERQAFEAITVGSRCQVSVSNAPLRRGTVMFKGEVEGLPGKWIGTKYDEPLGKNNGSYNGKKYFECQDKYGAFVNALLVECGDFPEEDDGLDDEI